MQRIAAASDNRITAYVRSTASHFLLVFTNSVTDGVAKCITTAQLPEPLQLDFTETGPSVTPDPEDAEVYLSPPGEWNVAVYSQNSSTNTNTSLATRIWSSEVYLT